MKYCLSCRQPVSVLKQADEIKVQHKDYRIISDLLVNYPQTRVIWELPRDFEDHKKLILQYNEIGEQNRLVCCLNSLAEVNWFKQNKVPFYYGFPIGTHYDLLALEELGVKYVRISPPLTHDIKQISAYNCEIRAIPNVAYDAYIPRKDGIIGGWIRPEDVQYYEQGIDVFEFEGNLNLEQERTMWEVYKKGEWPGNLNRLITNLNKNVTNVGLPKEFGRVRTTCRQRCAQNSNCNYCESAINLTNTLEKKLEGDKNNGRR